MGGEWGGELRGMLKIGLTAAGRAMAPRDPLALAERLAEPWGRACNELHSLRSVDKASGAPLEDISVPFML